MSKARTVVDDGFLIGVVFALFLAGKIVPYLILVGVIPTVLFWAKSDYSKVTETASRLFVPTALYFIYSIGLLYLYPGLASDVEPPKNPEFELYIVAVAMLVLGFLRSMQIKNLFTRFQHVTPASLFAAFAVLSIYMFIGIDGCRVRVAAPWPFIPALIFTSLAFLLILGWEQRSKGQRYVRLSLVSLSIVVVLAYTGSRGVAAGQLLVLTSFIVLRFRRQLRPGLPKISELAVATVLGLVLSALIAVATGCSNFDRWQAIPGFSANTQSDHSASINQNPTDKLPATNRANIQLASVQNVATSDPRSTTAAPSSSDEAISIRLNMWVVSLDAIREAPWFGHGALSLKTIIQDRFGYEHNHNQYLAWLVTGGIVFLGIGLAFLSTPAFISKGLAPVDRFILTLAVTGLWGGAMMFDAFFNLKFYLHYYCLLLGFLFALVQSATKTENYGKSL